MNNPADARLQFQAIQDQLEELDLPTLRKNFTALLVYTNAILDTTESLTRLVASDEAVIQSLRGLLKAKNETLALYKSQLEAKEARETSTLDALAASLQPNPLAKPVPKPIKTIAKAPRTTKTPRA